VNTIYSLLHDINGTAFPSTVEGRARVWGTNGDRVSSVLNAGTRWRSVVLHVPATLMKTGQEASSPQFILDILAKEIVPMHFKFL
jgi:hypothetical protein